MKLMAIAGEPSGDTHGGALLEGLRQQIPSLTVTGIGGPRMEAAGLQPIVPFSQLQVHGLVEVLAHLPRLYRLLFWLKKRLKEERPDALLLIDYPGFNLKLALAARKMGIPVVFYSSPQIWAWRGGRIKTIAQAVDKMVVLFPFEAPIYQKAGVRVYFAGHPLVGIEAAPDEVSGLQKRLGPPDGRPVVALLPGSRGSELKRHLSILLESVNQIEKSGWHGRWVVPLAPGLNEAAVRQAIQASGAPVELIPGAFLPLLKMAQLAIAASGTATLQVGLHQVPFIVVYKLSPLTYFLAKKLAYIRFASIVNILAGHEVAPELLQREMTPEKIAQAFLALANSPQRQQAMRQELGRLAAQMGAPGAYGRAASQIAAFLQERLSSASGAERR